MVRSRLPLPSLVCLFGALLMLSPEVLLARFITITRISSEVQIPLVVAVEQYNLEASDRDNYYKALQLKSWEFEEPPWLATYLDVKFVKTTCEKKADKLYYKSIQECAQIRGNHKEVNCYFLIQKRVSPIVHMKLDIIVCR